MNPPRPPQPRIRILQRRSDDLGRTIFQVLWLDKGNTITEENYISLKGYTKEIMEYEKNYEDRIVAWGTNHTRNTNGQSMQPEKQIEDANRKDSQWLRQFRDRMQEEGKGRVVEAVDVVSESDQKLQLKQTETNDRQQTAKIEHEEQNFYIFKKRNTIIRQYHQNNKRLSKLYVRASKRKIKEKTSKTARVMSKAVTQTRSVTKINRVYQQQGQWLASVSYQDNSQSVVLRDLLRLQSPQLLLAHYQQLFKTKRTDSDHIF